MIDWFIASLIQIVFVSLGWLLLKKARRSGLSNESSLAVYFVVLSLVLFVWQMVTGTFVIPSFSLLGFLVLAGILAAVSNLCIMYSFDTSPNQGLTLAVAASQSIIILLFGIFIFSARVSLMGGAGVLLVIAGIFIIHRKSSLSKWSGLAFLAAFLSAGYWLLVLLANMWTPLSSDVLLLYVSIPQIPIFIVARYILSIKKNKKENTKQYFSSVLLFAGVVGAIANSASIFAATHAPNPGYATAVGSASILLTLLVSSLLYKEKVTWKQLIGAIFVAIGVVALKLA